MLIYRLLVDDGVILDLSSVVLGEPIGNDIISSGQGDDLIGIDTAYIYPGSDSGNDIIGLGAGSDTVDAGEGDNTVYQANCSSSDGPKDVLTGTGDDYIQTGSGDDLLNADAGYNLLYGDAGRDTFTAGTDGYHVLGDFELGSDLIKLTDVSFEDFSFYQGSAANNNATNAFVFSQGKGFVEVVDTTVAQLNDAANFV